MQTWLAPAKLNLFLHVTGRRSDGYHLLQSVFQFLNFGDDLQFTVTNDDRVYQKIPIPGVSADNDLCVRAAKCLQHHTGCTKGVAIALTKRIPLGAGLGGGSSDAATTLLVLNWLWELNIPNTELIQLALSLGADVPVFVAGHAAWAEGVGEQLTAIDPPENWYLVLVPPVQISTAELFQDPQLTRNSPPITIRDFHEGRIVNDLEPVVRRRYPEVDAAIKWLEPLGSPRMTGTGAAVFMPVADQQTGEDILSRRPSYMTGFVARGLNLHPVVKDLHVDQ